MIKIAGAFAGITLLCIILGFFGLTHGSLEAFFQAQTVNMGVITVTSAFAALMGVKEEKAH